MHDFKDDCRIFIADDHEMILPGLKMIIESIPGCTVVGEAADGQSALEGILENRPDIAVLDLAMPTIAGFEVIRRIRRKEIPVAFLILSSFIEDRYIREAMDLSVNGYILKENSQTELINAIKSIRKGLKYMSPRILTRIVDSFSSSHNIQEKSGTVRDSLTQRELEIMQLITRGMTGKEVCAVLNISYSTLKTHKANIMKKLKISTTNELLVYAMKNNLFPLDV